MDLAKTQFLSLATKAVTTILGIAQSVIVIRLLSPADYGLIGLVMSIGGVIGVSQHLGIVDGAIREIAVLKSKKEIGKVFWVSHITRQIVTIPLSVGLFLLAGYIAVKFYNRPEIIPYIQLFAAVLVLQGLQDVLGATLTGMKNFVSLYIVQIITATINIAMFGLLTWKYGITGFFWAIIATTAIMIAFFTVIIAKNLKSFLSLPTLADIKLYGRRVLRIGAYMYMSRIFFVVWQRLPLLLLGAVLTADQLGYLNVSLTFGSRLTIIAMALSEVNLSWMSSLYAERRQEFAAVVTRNMHRVLVLMMMLTLGMLFFTPEILRYVIGVEYLPAQQLILVMTMAFFLYSLTDIGTSSLFVPADKPRLRALVFGSMLAVTGLVIWFLQTGTPNPLEASYAVLAGAAVAYLGMIVLAKKRFNISLLPYQLGIFLILLCASVAWLFTNPDLLYRTILFLVLTTYFIWEAFRSDLIPAYIERYLPLKKKDKRSTAVTLDNSINIICFAGAPYNQSSWTNRQHVMSRVSKEYKVLYVEPRMWFFRHIFSYWNKPLQGLAYIKRLFWYEKIHDGLYIKSQWNLLPGSREIQMIASFNHFLNRYKVLFIANILGINRDPLCVWIYDTEAAEYLTAFPKAVVLYDCVDDHAAQAGVDRNPKRVQDEEERIIKRANVVTVTSKRLLSLKKSLNSNVQLVRNVGNVDLFKQNGSNKQGAAFKAISQIPHPIIGSVGTLDSYKVDFEIVENIASRKPDWHIVLIGAPLVDHSKRDIKHLKQYANIHFLGAVPKEEVPALVVQFDVCVIPYKNNRYNKASFPLKFWEFMVTGKPLVVSGCPELREYKPLIGYAKTSNEMITLIEHSLEHSEEYKKERISLAEGQTWEHRVEKLVRLMEEAVRLRYRINP